MLTLPRFLHALEQLHTVRSAQELTQLITRLSQQLGFDTMAQGLQSYSRHNGFRVDSTSVISDQWHAHYVKQGYYQVDPRIHYCARQSTPLLWDGTEQYEHPRAAQMMRETRDFGRQAGIYAPTHSMDGHFSVICVGLRHVPQAEAVDVLRHAAPLMPALAAHAHEALLRLLPGGPRPKSLLTRRERECLQWAAAGKTSWEIGLVLHIAERTVNFHLNNAMAKLSCHSRQHAIATALMQGLIGL
jgi:DNA-binding CsgD family transcriptional regulator